MPKRVRLLTRTVCKKTGKRLYTISIPEDTFCKIAQENPTMTTYEFTITYINLHHKNFDEGTSRYIKYITKQDTKDETKAWADAVHYAVNHKAPIESLDDITLLAVY